MSAVPYGLAALEFFCFPGEAQVASWRKIEGKPQLDFFPEQGELDRGCNYFFGVACVFITYATDVYDVFPSEEDCRDLAEFHERIDAYMFQPSDRWSESAVLEEGGSYLMQNWERLRNDARKVLDDLARTLPSEPPAFDIPALVDLGEFRPID